MSNDCKNPNRPLRYPGDGSDLGYGQGQYGDLPYGGGVAPDDSAPFIIGPGFVRPKKVNHELNDLELNRMLQQMVVGITGIDGKLVRPRWQKEPGNQPDRETDWAAIGTINRDRDVFAAVLHFTNCDDPEDAVDAAVRNQELQVVCSFYGPNCESLSEILAMGLMLEQNRYNMQRNGFALIEVQGSAKVPELVKEEWLNGIDVPFRLRRQQAYVYPSPNLKSAEITLHNENKDLPISVSQEED